MDPEQSEFDKIIEAVGNHGYYQKRFNFIFNFILVILASMPFINVVIALAVPDHWCHIPGRELTNYSLEEWKELHIPMENDSRGKYSFSKCKMFDFSERYTKMKENVVDCKFGWDFDRTWYQETVATQEEWVCDKTLHVTNTFVFTRLGEVFGAFGLGHLADSIGRRPVFFISILLITIGRIATTFTSHQVYLFFAAIFIGSMPTTTVFQGPLIISMEISRSEDRASIAMIQLNGWTVGICIIPFIMWPLAHWMPFMCITSAPLALFLFSKRYIVESPRWLASKDKISTCIKQLNIIAKVNKTRVPEDTAIRLAKSKESEKSKGVLSLFSSWRLAKNCFLLVMAWSITVIVYYTITLNINNLGGNPFINYFWQGLAEFPAYIIGRYISDRFGRRWTNIFSFVGTAIGCIPLILIIQDETKSFQITIVSTFLKFCICFAFYVVQLQSLEIYPTCIRQTGVAIGGIVANFFAILGPYIVYIGTEVNATYPYVLSGGLCVVGAIMGIFLPETQNKKLPETLADAAVFGADQNLCGTVKRKIVEETEVPLKCTKV